MESRWFTPGVGIDGRAIDDYAGQSVYFGWNHLFEVDGVKVMYFSAENFKLAQIIEPAMNGIFESAGSALELGEGILKIFGDRISTDDIEQARKDIQQAREEIEQEREKIREELQNLKLN
jgi:hypothetical protein